MNNTRKLLSSVNDFKKIYLFQYKHEQLNTKT